MLRHLSRRAASAALCLLAVGALGCESDERLAISTQAPLSDYTAEQRSHARAVLAFFDGRSASGVDADGILQLIAAEGVRVFAGAAAAGEVVIRDRPLDLTSEAVLPEEDAFGNVDATGGWIAFDEVGHDEEGAEVGRSERRQQARAFTAGGIARFSFENVREATEAGAALLINATAFEVSSPVVYEETSWHQQAGWTQTAGVNHDETWAYQDHPSLRVTLEAGGVHDARFTTTDSADGGGWTVDQTFDRQTDVAGTITRYRPKQDNALPNANEAAAEEREEVVEDGVRVTTVTSTVVREATGVAGPAGALEELREITTTTTLVARTDATTDRFLSRELDTHTTTRVSYRPRPDQANEALRLRLDERFVDHVETERVVEQTERTYDSDTSSSYDETVTVTTWRHTDNPSTRNDLARWRSTRQTTTLRVEQGEGQVSATHGGVEWLTDQIEVDPDFDARPFVWTGRRAAISRAQTRFLGDDLSGTEETTTSEEKLAFASTDGRHEIAVDGLITSRTARVDNGDGARHTVPPTRTGALRVSVDGGAERLVSAAEWAWSFEPPED